MSDAKLSNVDAFDALLNGAIADIPEEAGLINLYAGQYLLKILTAEVKDVETKGAPDRAIAIMTEVVEVQNLKDESLVPQDVGSKAYFSFRGAQGLSKLVKAFGDVIKDLEPVSTADFIEKLRGLEILASISNQKDKTKVRDDGTAVVYVNIDMAVLAG